MRNRQICYNRNSTAFSALVIYLLGPNIDPRNERGKGQGGGRMEGREARAKSMANGKGKEQ